MTPLQRTILVVDDETMIAEDLCESLQEAGYRVLTPAHSGPDALRKVQEESPDLVLMDINLKGDMDGINTTQAIQKIDDCAVIYLTANADSQTLQRAKMTNPFGYIIKPFRERELHAMVEISLYRHAQEKQAKLRQNMFMQTLDNTPDAILVLNELNELQFMNPSAEALLETTLLNEQGKTLQEIARFYDPESQNPVDSFENIRKLTPLILMLRNQKRCKVKLFTAALHDTQGKFQGRVLNLYQQAQAEAITPPQQLHPAHDVTTICASCKQIRMPSGEFSNFETYFRQYFQVKFSHGICPHCFEQLYPNYLETLKD